jgi:hypothetical protein
VSVQVPLLLFVLPPCPPVACMVRLAFSTSARFSAAVILLGSLGLNSMGGAAAPAAAAAEPPPAAAAAAAAAGARLLAVLAFFLPEAAAAAGLAPRCFLAGLQSPSSSVEPSLSITPWSSESDTSVWLRAHLAARTETECVR